MANGLNFTVTPKLEARFWSRVEKSGDNDCWSWTGTTRKGNRGEIYVSGSTQVAPRVSYVIHNGAIPEGDNNVLHSCDNPNCVNPAHLWLGTIKDNSVDAASKGRVHGQAKTHCPSGHPYDGENLRIDEHGRRRCRTCHKRHDTAFRERRKLKRNEQGAGK